MKKKQLLLKHKSEVIIQFRVSTEITQYKYNVYYTIIFKCKITKRKPLTDLNYILHIQ